MAAASGLDLVKTEERDPIRTTSYGHRGQLIKAAMDAGLQRYYFRDRRKCYKRWREGECVSSWDKFLDRCGNEIGSWWWPT